MEKDLICVKEKLESLLELSHNHQNKGSGSVGYPKSTDNDSKTNT